MHLGRRQARPAPAVAAPVAPGAAVYGGLEQTSNPLRGQVWACSLPEKAQGYPSSCSCQGRMPEILRTPPSAFPGEGHQMQKTIETHFPNLSRPQLTGLVLSVCATILAGSACQNAVASGLSPWCNWNNLRQYLREWSYGGSERTRPCQPPRANGLNPRHT